MSRTSRYRSKDTTYQGSMQDWISGNPIAPVTNTITRTSRCYDWIGRPVTDMSFDSEQKQGCLLLDGRFQSAYQPSAGRYTVFDKYPSGASSNYENLEVPLEPPSGWALDLLVRTNPSRPVITPLTLLQDLVELPSMLLQAGRLLKNPRSAVTPKGAASTYLGALFGWLPLVDDIKHMLDLQSYADKRAQELHKMFTRAKGLKRRINMDSTHKVEAYNKVFAGQGSASLTVPISVSIGKRSWATVRWYPSGPVPWHPNDAEVNKLARRVVSGMTTEGLAKGLWDVLPWTWMVNWFTNIGKYALQYSNTVPATHSKPCFMSELSITCVVGVPFTSGILTNDVKVTCDQTYIRKTRTVSGAVTPGFYLPFLDKSRLSIISALGIQKWKPFL